MASALQLNFKLEIIVQRIGSQISSSNFIEQPRNDHTTSAVAIARCPSCFIHENLFLEILQSHKYGRIANCRSRSTCRSNRNADGVLMQMLNRALVGSTALKLLLIPSYRSTDFEVHRNWLAITYSLPLYRWYYENTSEWTLDYPPLFAYWEWFLAQLANLVDPEMLRVENLGYASDRTIWFQRASVLVSELILFFALKKLSRETRIASAKLVSLSIFLSPGFLIIDHMHFQYNGAMYGLLLYSIIYLRQSPITAAFIFASLLCFKHIYLYLAPAYFIYLLRTVVLRDDLRGIKIVSTIRLGLAVVFPIVVAFAPFIYLGQMPQVLSRLFPFNRGLCHAYWAPNFWALYSFVDRIAIKVGPRLHLPLKLEAIGSVTRGLVGDTSFAFLPEISPRTTFVITIWLQLVALIKLFYKPTFEVFLGALTLCGYASFFFGWHVHEKAVLLVILPASLLALRDTRYFYAFRPLLQAGCVSLLPLIYTGKVPIAVTYVVLYLIIFLHAFATATPLPIGDRRFLLDRTGQLYTICFVPLIGFSSIIHPIFFSNNESMSFLPLMLTSVYCAWGILWSWFGFNYLYFTAL